MSGFLSLAYNHGFADELPFPEVEAAGFSHDIRAFRRKKDERNRSAFFAGLERLDKNRPPIVSTQRFFQTDDTGTAPARRRRNLLASIGGGIELEISDQTRRHLQQVFRTFAKCILVRLCHRLSITAK